MSANAEGMPADTYRDEDLLTPEECARWLRVSTSTLERWRLVGGGAGPHFHKGPGKRAKVTYLVRDVRLYLQSCRRSSTSESGR